MNEETIYCIFCFGINNLINNEQCLCDYYFHKNCFLLWIKTSTKNSCIICQKIINTNRLITYNHSIININDDLDDFITMNEDIIPRINLIYKKICKGIVLVLFLTLIIGIVYMLFKFIFTDFSPSYPD